MPWLVSILKSVASFLLPHALDKLKEWFVAWYEARRKAQEQAKAIQDSADKAEEKVIEAPKPEMTDEERINAQKKAWTDYVNWFGRNNK